MWISLDDSSYTLHTPFQEYGSLWRFRNKQLQFEHCEICVQSLYVCIKIAGHYVSGGDHTCPRLATAQVTWTPN